MENIWILIGKNISIIPILLYIYKVDRKVSEFIGYCKGKNCIPLKRGEKND